MTSYRLWPATNGPATPTAYSGNFISGLVFTVTGGNNWFEGYWWWVCGSGQSTSPVKCALWTAENLSGTSSGSVVPGSVVTSGTLTAGQWNYIPLPTPIQLAPGHDANLSTNGSLYVAAIGCNGAFPDTNGYWTTSIANGPLFAYGGIGNTNPAPWSFPQGVFSTGGSDPSTTLPASASSIDNFWVDVQVTNTAPTGYSGSYRLWPNKIDTNNTVTGDAAFNYTIATEIHLSQTCELNNIWYFSPAGATTLATQCDVWDISTGLSVATITTPSWTDASGTAYTPPGTASPAAGSGTWIKAAFAANTNLGAGSYRVSVYNSAGTTDGNWSPKDASTDYWGETLSGVGVNGITWGPLFAPGYSTASAGYLYGGPSTATPPYSNGTAPHAQPVFGQTGSGVIEFPDLFAPTGGSSNETQNYWVDLEVTPSNFTEVGSFLQTGFTGSGTLSMNNQAVGDLILLSAITTDSNANYISSVSGGGCTWVQVGTAFTGTVNSNKIVTLWQGTVTATGAQTATLTATGGSPTIRVVAKEFSVATGNWTIVSTIFLDSAGTNTWSSFAADSEDLYFGFAINNNTAVAGTTSGYTYNVMTTYGDGCAWNTNCTAGSTAPVWGDSTEAFGVMTLVRATAAGGNVSVSGATATATVTAYFGSVAVSVAESPAANYVAAYFGNVSMSIAGSIVNTGVSALFGNVQLGVSAPVAANQVSALFGSVLAGVNVTEVPAGIMVTAPYGSVIVPISITELPAAANVVAYFGSVTTNSIPVNIVWTAKLLPSWKATIITD